MLLAIVGGMVLSMTPPAAAQTDPDRVRLLERRLQHIDASYRLTIPQDQPISERLMLDYGGSYRFGFFSIDDAQSNSRILRQHDGILYALAELDGAHRFFGRLRFRYHDYRGDDSFDGRGDRLITPIGDRYWYQFDLRGLRQAQTGETIDYNINIKGGRQFVHWGSGIAFSNQLYGGLLDVEVHDWGIVGLAGITPASSTVDFDASRRNFDRNTKRAFFGGMLEYRGFAQHRPYFYALVQRDRNNDERTFITPIGNFPTRFDYDSEYWALGSRGTIGRNLRYHAEVIHQTGEGLSNSFDPMTGAAVAQTREDISAWAGIAGLTYLFRDPGDTRIDFEFIGGSGDRDRIRASDTFGGNQPGTRDRAFNALGYVNTGLALAPDVTNLLSFRLGASTTPFPRAHRRDWMRFGVYGFLFFKADSRAPLTVNTTNDTFVGGELNVNFDWRITSDLNASVRYGVFFPGDAMPSGEDSTRHFVYAGLTYAF